VLKWRNLQNFSVLVKMPPSKLSANKTAFYNTGGGLPIQGFFAQGAGGQTGTKLSAGHFPVPMVKIILM
jgi:hypothetical protein